MEQYFETENQRFYYSRGLQFRFSYNVTQVVGYKQNYLHFTPHLEILFSNGHQSAVNPSYQVMQPASTFNQSHPQAVYYSGYQPLVGQK